MVDDGNQDEAEMEDLDRKNLSMKRNQRRFGFKNTGHTLKRTGIKGLKTETFGV